MNSLQIIISFAILAVLSPTLDAQASWAPGLGCPKYSGKVFVFSGAYANNIRWIEAAFRRALGGEDNLNGPAMARGHRSINWDAPGVPFEMPFDFFKINVPRGAEFHTSCNLFAVSNPENKTNGPIPNSGGRTDNRFSSFRHVFKDLFRTFSARRLFAPVKTNDVTTLFSVPGASGSPRASVSGFAAIFTNVVLRGQTKIAYFDENNCPIVTVAAPPFKRGLSFVGVIVNKKNGYPVRAAVASVRILLGNAAISEPLSKWKNFVVLDDLIYGEPQKL